MNNDLLLLILERFIRKYKYMRVFREKHFPNILNLEFINMRIRDCVYSFDFNNIIRKNIIIYYRYKGEQLSLNLLLDDYKDLIYTDEHNNTDMK
jgi:hypothetical protein